MKVFAVAGNDEIAKVYIAEFDAGKAIEFVEAVQPPEPRLKKWVLMVSTLFGCPVKCAMCDAGGGYRGKLTKAEILAQIDFLVQKRFPGGQVPVEKFKIQLARMGEPAFNLAVLDVLEDLPGRYHAPGLMPSLSTVAPRGAERFFERLITIKDHFYPGGKFQFQFSIHTTDLALRDQLVPTKKWDFREMAAYGDRFLKPGDRKITLNFALAASSPVSVDVLLEYFNPQKYFIKITPINPTVQATRHGLVSYVNPQQPSNGSPLVQTLRAAGYETVVSIGEVEENQIGSNCGQYLLKFMQDRVKVDGGYTYSVEPILESELRSLQSFGRLQ